MRAALALHGRAGDGPGRHERRARPDRRRPDGRGGRRVPGPRDGARRGARASGSRRSCGRCAKRWPNIDRGGDRARPTASRRRSRAGASVLEPVGTAPGLVVPPAERPRPGPTVVVLPGPPRELQPMWAGGGRDARRCARRWPGATVYRQRTLRLFGIPESEIAETLRVAERDGRASSTLIEITTCLQRGEVEIVTRYEPDAGRPSTTRSRAGRRERHADTLFSDDGRTVDEQVAALLRRRLGPPLTIAAAESCTGGLLRGPPDRAARLLGLRARRDRRLLRTRSRSSSAGVPRGADRAPRRRLRGGRARRSPQGAARALRRGRRGRHHRHRRARRRHRREAGRARLARGRRPTAPSPLTPLGQPARRPRRRARPRDDGRAAPGARRAAASAERPRLAPARTAPGGASIAAACPAVPQPGCSRRSTRRRTPASGSPSGHVGLAAASSGAAGRPCGRWVRARCT